MRMEVAPKTLFPVAESHPELLGLIERTCRWELLPSSWPGGRSALIALPSSLNGDTGLGAVKLKGLGLCPSGDAPARPPQEETYDRWPGQDPDPHFAIGPDCQFGLADGDPAPVGGLTMDGVERELACAAGLCEHGVRSVVPLASFAYPTLRYSTPDGQMKWIGVAATGSRLTADARCSAIVPGWDERAPDASELRRVARALGVPEAGRGGGVASRLHLLGEAYRSFGISLRSFSAAGWYRYSGHPANFQIDEAGNAILVDLDSCRQMSDISPEVAGLEAVRDGMSGLYNLACTFFLPGVLSQVDDETLRRIEPFSAFLDGWDPGSKGKNRPAAEAIVDYIVPSRSRLREFYRAVAPNTPTAERLYRYVRHDRDLTYTWFFRHLCRRRFLRPVRPSLTITTAALDSGLYGFAGGPRFARTLELEDRAKGFDG